MTIWRLLAILDSTPLLAGSSRACVQYSPYATNLSCRTLMLYISLLSLIY